MAYTHVLMPGGRGDEKTLHPEWALPTIEADTLPPAYASRRAAPHSLEAHAERQIAGSEPTTTGTSPDLSLRSHQTPRVEEIVSAWSRGAPGYHLNYPTGSGKTITVAEACRRISADLGRTARIVLVAPRSAQTAWTGELDLGGTGDAEWITTTPQSITRLFRVDGHHPRELRGDDHRHELVARDGRLRIGSPDIVVFDESHALSNHESTTLRIWQRLIGWTDGQMPAAFTINTSATSFTDPKELAYTTHLLAYTLGRSVPSREEIAADTPGLISDMLDIPVVGKPNPSDGWLVNAPVAERLAQTLFDGGVGSTATPEEIGLPGQPRTLHPIRLSGKALDEYEKRWAKQEVGRALEDGSIMPASDESPLTKAQKEIIAVSSMKTPHVIKGLIRPLLKQGHQVIVPTAFLSVAEAYQDGLDVHGIESVVLKGSLSLEERDLRIRRFQSGQVPVIITTVIQSLSLHAGQARGGIAGADASDTPRATVCGDIITGGKRLYQAEGRGTRDGQVAEAHYPYVPQTREAAWLHRVFTRMADTRSLTGADASDRDLADFHSLTDQIQL